MDSDRVRSLSAAPASTRGAASTGLRFAASRSSQPCGAATDALSVGLSPMAAPPSSAAAGANCEAKSFKTLPVAPPGPGGCKGEEERAAIGSAPDRMPCGGVRGSLDSPETCGGRSDSEHAGGAAVGSCGSNARSRGDAAPPPLSSPVR
ncbi:unnamed protein product, partial [Ectocarpus sp. 13 AM-2016]